MYLQTLKSIATIKRLNQSDLARYAGISRQRVSQWFKSPSADGLVNIQTTHLLALAKALEVSPDTLLKPLPIVGEEQQLKLETTRLLWDRLYPDLTSLVVAVLEFRPQAVARFVQIYGLYSCAKLFGARVWRDFDEYKQFIHPIRRRELEHLCQFQKSLMKP